MLYGDVTKDAKKQSHFALSYRWLNSFCNIKMIDNPAAASCTAKELPCLFNVTVVKGGYKMKQVFNLDEIGLLWKDVAIYSLICQPEDSRNATHCCWEERLLGTTNRAPHGVSFTESMGTELICKNKIAFC